VTSSKEWREHLAPFARYRCGYCQTQEKASGIKLTLEHIIPLALGGLDEKENLWLSCRLCNEAKGIIIEYSDIESGILVPLFNPRTDEWNNHFSWDESGTQIIGLTLIGKVTIEALDLNNSFRLQSRAIWVEAGWHPPSE
jgi:hypothetical protein